MFKYLKRLDPNWPVEVALADVGHSRAQNKPRTWQRLNDQAFQWLQSHINGSHEQRTTVSSEATVCEGGDSEAPQQVVGRTPEDLANHTLTFQLPQGGTQGDTAATDPNGPATDPIVGPRLDPGEPCRRSKDGLPATGGYTAYTPPFARTETYVGLGHVDVTYVWAAPPPPEASGLLAVRLFDAVPGGEEFLVTRGVYRLENNPPVGTLRIPFFGNHWRVRPGHRLRLDITQVDAFTFRPSNVPSTFTFSDVKLVLPTR